MALDKYPPDDRRLTSHEYEYMLMVKGFKPWPNTPMAWINAVHEFMVGFGYVTKSGTITNAGEAAYDEYRIRYGRSAGEP